MTPISKQLVEPIVSRKPVVRPGAEGKRLEPPSGPQIVKVSAADTLGAFEVVDIVVVPGAGPPLHMHPGFDEAFYVLEGRLTVRLGDRTIELGAHGSAVVPAGTPHTWKNAASENVRFLQITAPGSMEELLEAIAARPLLGIEELAQLAEPHGTLILGPGL